MNQDFINLVSAMFNRGWIATAASQRIYSYFASITAITVALVPTEGFVT